MQNDKQALLDDVLAVLGDNAKTLPERIAGLDYLAELPVTDIVEHLNDELRLYTGLCAHAALEAQCITFVKKTAKKPLADDAIDRGEFARILMNALLELKKDKQIELGKRFIGRGEEDSDIDQYVMDARHNVAVGFWHDGYNSALDRAMSALRGASLRRKKP